MSLSSPDGFVAAPAAADASSLVDEVERRLVERIDALERWTRDELDEHVLRLVERRLEEETERRAWRVGTEVF